MITGRLRLAISSWVCLFVALSVSRGTAQEPSGADWHVVDIGNLAEWSDPGAWWKVEDGVVVAESKGGEGIPEVHYLVWSGSVPQDFELRLEYRIVSDAPQDAGVNFRVERPFNEAPNLPGYQAELDTAYLFGNQKGKLFGNIHDGKRGKMFGRSKRVTVKPDGEMVEEPFAEPFDPKRVFKEPPQWNACRIEVVGNHVKLYLNDVLANEIIDGDEKMRSRGDAIALQFRPVNTYRYEVRDLRFRKLEQKEHP